MKKETFFIKKANQRTLNRHQEPANLGFAAGASALLGAIISFFSFNTKTLSLIHI